MTIRILLLTTFLFPWVVNGAELTKHQVIADGHPITVWEKTPARPRAQILLLHGRTWSSLPDFDLQVEGEDLSFMDGLNNLGYSVFALDARGYGDTPRDNTGWLTPDRSVADATLVLAWMKNRSSLATHLYGWSYGSMVSQLLVQRHPEIVRSVILFGYPVDPDRLAMVRDIEYPDTPPALPNTYSNAISDFIVPDAISQKAINAYAAAALKADPIRVDFRGLEQWSALDPTSVTTPLLLLQGEFDPLAKTPNQARFFGKAATPHKTWVVLPGGDHAALLEKPRQLMLNSIDFFIQNLPVH